MAESGCEKAWWDKLRRPYLKNLERVMSDLQEGRDVRQLDLRRALFLLLRDNKFAAMSLFVTKCSSDENVAKSERSLSEASSTVAALRLPRKKDGGIPTSTLFLLTFRGAVSKLHSASGCHPSAPFDPWAWLELLVQYATQLEGKLELLASTSAATPRRGGRHAEQGVDDECLLLATLSALALRAVKTSFRSSYVDIPWEEVEFVLVSFIEAHTVYESWAFVFATVSTVLRYLRDLKPLLAVFKAQRFGQAMKTLSKAPSVTRPAFLAGLKASGDAADRRKAAMFQGCAVVRDYESLKIIKEALEVAIGALGMSEADYRQHGCLAFHRALFVVGERMKNTWESPNLSDRYGKLIETMASENLVATMKRIRNGLAHPAGAAESSAAAKLASKEAKRRMATDLSSIVETVGVLLYGAEWDLLQGLWDYSAPHCDLLRALKCTLKYKTPGINPIQAELSRLLDSISRRNPNVAKTVFQPFTGCKELLLPQDYSRGLNRQRFLHGVGGTTLLSTLLKFDTSAGKQQELCRLISTVPFSEDVAKFVRLWRLSHNGEEISSFQTSLVDACAQKPSSDDVALALAAIQTLPDKHNIVTRYTLDGAVRILASSWHEAQERPQPVAGLYAPCLFGRHLRNYLNHGDKFIQVCCDPNSEIRGIWIMLTSKLADGAPAIESLHGAQPRPVPLAEARAEHDRLLRLVQLKCGMFRSALAGDVAGVARAAEAGADVASRDSQGRTLLHAAAAAGQEAVVRWLLALGPQAVQPAAVDWLGRTALHEASSAAVAEALLQAGLPVEVWDLRLQTPLSRAASGGRVEVVRLLLGHPWRADHSAPDLHSGRKPMHWAAWHGHVEVLQLLLEAGATCEAVGVDAVTPLRLAARGGHADAVRFLLGPRARPRPSDKECVQCIGAAAICRQAVAFHVLLEELRRRTPAFRWTTVVLQFQAEVFEGGDKDVIDVFLRECPLAEEPGDLSLLERAALASAEHSVRVLLARGAKPTARRNPFAKSALHFAIQGGSLSIVRAILDHIPKGHSLRTGCRELISPLFLALFHNRLEVVQLLVQEGADFNAQMLGSLSPLLLAAKFGNVEAVKFLLERGARWQPTAAAWTPLHAAWTPLHAAAFGGHFGVVKVLVPAGTPGDAAQCRQSLALVQCADESGWTALLCALWSGSAAVVKYLLRREAELLQHGLAGRRCSALQRDKGGRSVLELCAVWGCGVDLVEPVLAFLKDHGPAAGLSAEELLASVKDVQGKIQEGRNDGGQMGPLLVKWISLLEPQPVADVIAPFQALGIAPPKALEMETQRKAEETGQSSAFCEGEGLKKSAEENHQDPTENTAVAGKAAPSALGVAPTKSRKNKKKKSKGRNQKSSQRSVVPDGKAFEKNTADNDQNASINPTAHASEGSLPVGRVAEAKEGDCTLEQQPVAESLDSALALPKALNKERKKSKDAYQNSAACDGEGLVKDTEESDQPVPENSDFPDSVDWLVVDAVADLANDTNVNNMAFKMKIIQMVLWKGVRRLSSLWCPNDPVWSKALLQAAAPTLEALHVRVVQAEHLAVIHAMPRLRRLYVASDPVLYANPVTLPPLPAGHPGGLHWVRAYMPIATWASLVRGHAHSLREVVLCAGTRGPPGYEDHYPYACTDLSPVFQGRALPALRRVVVWRSSSFVHDKSDCRVQLAAIRAVLGASVSVVCNRCVEVRQDEFHELCEGEQCRRVFVVPE